MVHPFFLLAFLALLGVIEAKCPYKNYTGCPPWVQERRREIEERNRKKFEEDERINKFHRTRGPIPSTSGPYEFTKPDIYIMLNKHNNYRSYMANGLLKGKQAKNMYKLVWDPLLQKSAQEWANKCTIEASNTPDVGENRYVLDDDSRLKLLLSMVAEMAVMEWTDEPDYSPLSEDNKYRAGIDSAISNYTQLVWGATTKFGCGGCVRYEESGNRSTYIICHYQVKGNIDGEYIYEVGGGCANDDDCTTYSGSKCEVSTKLCLPSDYVEEKFF